MEQDSARDSDRDIDDRPLRRRRGAHVRGHLALVHDRQDEAERHHRDQRIDAGRELQHRKDPVPVPAAIHDGVDGGRRAEGGDRRQGDRLHPRLGPGRPGEIAEYGEERGQRHRKGRHRLAEGDPQVGAVDQRHRRQAEVGAEQHAQPTERQAHERREVLDLLRVQQAGDPGTEEHPDQHVLGAADIAVPVAQPVEQQVGEDVPDGDDCEGCQRSLHWCPGEGTVMLLAPGTGDQMVTQDTVAACRVGLRWRP